MTEEVESLAIRLARSFADLGPGAHDKLDEALGQLTTTELAAVAYDWREVWAREKQKPPRRRWRSFGMLSSRAFGKTRAASEFINEEVREGRAPLIGLAAQTEELTIAIQVLGPSGLVATSPPWFKAEWEATAKQVVWPNGARAYVRTPEVPGNIRGIDYHLCWLSELQSWPAPTRMEAMMNFDATTRLGLARKVWDATPKKGNPLIKSLLMKEDEFNIIVRGVIEENRANIGDGVIEDLRKNMVGQQAMEELDGIYSEDDEEALWRSAWIQHIHMPDARTFRRRIITIDPAISTGDTSDATGMGEQALMDDGDVLVIDDMTGKHEAHAWATIALDRYVFNGCDLIVAEINRGGNLVTQNLRAAAEKMRLRIEVVGPDWRPHRTPGVVYVREVSSKGSKGRRAAPVATYYQRGRVKHLLGANLAALEELQTTWVPPPEGSRANGRRSPDALDAAVMGVVELAGLAAGVSPDPAAAFLGVDKVAAATRTPITAFTPSALALPRAAWGSRL